MDVETRTRSEEFRGEEEAEAHPRGERPEAVEINEETPEETGAEAVAEKGEKQPEIGALVVGWNAYLKKEKILDRSIDQKDFLRATRLSEHFVLDSRDFKNILEKYYKFKKSPVKDVGALEKDINKFFKEIKSNS
ncbi:MAG: hypothetical protein ABSB00_03640 [Minisyncoccia bacterium]|jgi:hypothetical protein